MMKPGPTLADCKDPEKRIRKLRETRANLQAQMNEKQHAIILINREIMQLENQP